MTIKPPLSSEYRRRKIKDLRRSLALTQESLAERAGLSVETIQRLERTAKCSSRTTSAVAKALGTTPQDLNGPPKSFVTAIMNEKGGVGRTTICFNLAALLAARGHKVCAVQVDESGQLFDNCCARPRELPSIFSCILPHPELLDDWVP